MVALNEQARTCVIPIGRHSLMNGVFMRVGAAPKTAEIEGFVIELQGIFHGADRLMAWSQEVVRRNCIATGLTGSASIPLVKYLEVMDSGRLPRRLAVQAMLDWWRR